MEKQNFKGVPESNWVVGPCQTEEIAKQVLAVAHAYGWEWQSGLSFIRATHFFSSICYNLIKGRESSIAYYDKAKYQIISPEIFLANNPMPKEKTRKPGVKYTLEDWKKEADACRKRAEYWKDKFFSMNEFYDQLKLENKQLKAFADELKSEKDFIDTDRNDVRHTLANIKLDLEHTNKNFTILQTQNKVLKEGNENLRNSNDELLKSSTEAKQELGFAKLKIQDLEKSNVELRNAKDEVFHSYNETSKALGYMRFENDSLKTRLTTVTENYNLSEEDCAKLHEELKTVKSHLDLRTKGIQVLEHDAKLNRIEIASLKYDFETKNSELEILEEDYNCLKDVQKYTKVVGWAGWILFFIALFGLMFFKG